VKIDKLKLLIITASFPVGNGEGFLEEEFQSLEEQGVNLTVVPLFPRGKLNHSKSFKDQKNKYIIRPLIDVSIIITSFYYFLCSPLRVGKWVYTLMRSNSWEIRIKNLTTIPKALWMIGLIKKREINHVHVHWASTTSTCGMIAADFAGVEWSFTAHRWDIYNNNLLAEKGRRATFVRFISCKGINDGIALGVPAEKGIVIHMGVSLKNKNISFSSRSIDLPIRIVCAANLIPVKGHQYLLQAISGLKKNGVQVSLDLIGQGKLRGKLEQLVYDYGIDSIVKFKGQIKHSELMSSYRRGDYDLFVLPSIDMGSGEHEGIPVSLMEAMAYGIPVLSTRTGSIEELLPRQIGATVPDKDTNALLSVLSVLATNEEYRREYTIMQTKIIKEWNSELVAKKLIKSIMR